MDPQLASKQLVDHALARFSTDNLSCMVVRFDNKALKQRKADSSVGVEGDPVSAKGAISETDAIVSQAKAHRGNSGDDAPPMSPTSIAEVEEEAEKEPGPELNVEALRARRKDL